MAGSQYFVCPPLPSRLLQTSLVNFIVGYVSQGSVCNLERHIELWGGRSKAFRWARSTAIIGGGLTWGLLF